MILEKNDIIYTVYKYTCLPKNKVIDIINTLIDILKEEIIKGNRILITKYFTITPITYKQRFIDRNNNIIIKTACRFKFKLHKKYRNNLKILASKIDI